MSSTTSKNCSFCSNKGIPGPHGHLIRDFTKANKPITCPQLLSIECGYCHEKGHTVKYCHVLKSKKLSNSNNSCSHIIQESRPNKRAGNFIDFDGFTHINRNNSQFINSPLNSSSNKLPKQHNFTSYFAALDVSDDESDSDIEPKETIEQNLWANTVSNKQGANSLREKLGIKEFVGKWGDDMSDDEFN